MGRGTGPARARGELNDPAAHAGWATVARPSELRAYLMPQAAPEGAIAFAGLWERCPQAVIDNLHRKIGQLQVERDFLAGQPAIARLLKGGQ